MRYLILAMLALSAALAAGLAPLWGAPPQVNAPPAIILSPTGEGAICPPGEGAAIMDASIEDDGFAGNPLSLSWEQLSGPSIVRFVGRRNPKTMICFKRAGVYDFRLLAYDEEFLVTADTRITVLPAP